VPSAGNQQQIADALGVGRFDPATDTDVRVAFLREQAEAAGARALVLGVSGGVDSAVAGMLCRRAADTAAGFQFIAVRLPYGVQHDEADARNCVDAMRPDRTYEVDIRPASDAALTALTSAGLTFASPSQADFVLGNIKARQRMIVQYALANTLGGLVVGTDHAAEAVTGFFTKYGDGGVDVTPLTGLTKRRVRALGAHLGLPDRIVQKTPTADLESLRPQLADEDALGVTYEQIDNFLEGRDVDAQTVDILTRRYRDTAHKRTSPASPNDPGSSS
jgi:NAD+ synthase